MIDARQQFRLLYRGFLLRFLDIELLSSQGAMHNLLSQIAALLAALSFVLMLLKVPQYAFASAKLTAAQIAVAAWGDQEFLISTTMAVIGIFTVLTWDSLFPDRRDCLVLGSLPVRLRTMFAAKSAAIVSGLGLTILSVNVFTGLTYPFLAASGSGILSVVRGFAAYWITMIAASLFLFASLLALQGIAIHLLPHGRFLRFSGYLQLTAFFVIVSTYFLMPPLATARALAAPENQNLLRCLPSFWFLGLYQELNGGAPPVFVWLAQRAIAATTIALLLAGATYALGYGRHVRQTVEQSGVLPADRGRAANPVARHLARWLFPKPLERALFLFIARTLIRSRQHRMLLAIYGAIGLSVSLVYLREMLYRSSSWHRPDTPLLAIGVVMLFFSVVGIRLCFALPDELRANWIFRLTEAESLAVYRAAIRKTLLALVVAPLWIVSAIVYPSLWPWGPAVGHLAVLALFSILVVEVSLKGFRKIPFTCSYLPGQANLKVSMGAYVILLLALTDLGVKIELASITSLRGWAIFSLLIVAGIFWTRRQSARALAPPFHRLLFEEQPLAEVNALDLHTDAKYFADPAVEAAAVR